jgi:hypothetical protein
MSRQLHRLWLDEQIFEFWREALTDNQQTEEEIMDDIFGHEKIFANLILNEKEARENAKSPSIDEEIAALRAQDPGGQDPVAREEYGKKITELYRLKYGSQKLKSY